MVSRNIAKRPNGRWRARYRDEMGKEHARHFDRKVDAQRWLDEVTAQVLTGAYVDPKAGRMTFGRWFDEWSSRQVWVPRTEIQNEMIRRQITFADVPLAQLRESHIQAWVKLMQSQEFAANTINTRMMPIRAALRAAVRDRRLVLDPSAGVILPRRGRRSQTMVMATTEQVGRLLAATEPRMKAFLGVCAFAGLRLGEASALKVEDIDFLRRRLEVRRQVQKGRSGSELRSPKYESGRTVYLSDELVEVLARHVQTQAIPTEGWLFSSQSGGPLPPTTANAWWLRTCEAAGVVGITTHSLRHYFASGLIADGCDVVTVQRALGHKSATVTLNTYSHLWPTAEDKTRQASGRMAAEALALSVADWLRTGPLEIGSDLHQSP
jgi:integrase